MLCLPLPLPLLSHALPLLPGDGDLEGGAVVGSSGAAGPATLLCHQRHRCHAAPTLQACCRLRQGSRKCIGRWVYTRRCQAWGWHKTKAQLCVLHMLCLLGALPLQFQVHIGRALPGEQLPAALPPLRCLLLLLLLSPLLQQLIGHACMILLLLQRLLLVHQQLCAASSSNSRSLLGRHASWNIAARVAVREVRLLLAALLLLSVLPGRLVAVPLLLLSIFLFFPAQVMLKVSLGPEPAATTRMGVWRPAWPPLLQAGKHASTTTTSDGFAVLPPAAAMPAVILGKPATWRRQLPPSFPG